MPSQEEYLDNLLKGIGNTTDKNIPQIDMSDMDDLLQSALEAQQEDVGQEHSKQSDVIHPEETSTMSEDEIDRLLQRSQEQAENASQQEPQDSNDDLIKMLEDADDEGLSGILDQAAPKTDAEEVADAPEDDRQQGDGKREKEKKEKKPGFFAHFHKKAKEETESAQKNPESIDEVPVADAAETTEEMPTTDREETEDTGMAEDDLDALLAGAFPDKPSDTPETSEPADVMDILKAAGADIVEEQEPAEQKKEKKGFFAKLLDLFTEEEDEEEEAEQIQLSEENKKILDEMDKEKKEKTKKEKQPKAKKPPKEKKKKPSVEEKSAVPEKKLSPKKVIPIVVVCFTLGAVILLVSNFLTEYMTRRSGRQAYYAGDYQTCYQNLFGKDLNETEQIMYSKSESILTIRMWLREYDVFVNEGSELEALDSLLQAVHDYPSLLTYATEWNAQDEVTAAFQDILNILAQKYQLSQEEAQRIAGISNNVEYTQNVMQVLQNLGLGSWEFPEGNTQDKDAEQTTEAVSEPLPDPLPEESAILQ